MSFQPVIPFSGAAGWSFLQRTKETQQTAFESSAVLQRDVKYFEEKIGNIDTAEQLVSDRRLLSVALGAYGLNDDINNTYFIQKVLEDGTIDPSALSNKLSDKRYYEMAKDFGFGDLGIPSTQISDFGVKTIDSYKERQFEIAVGNQSQDMRLAMSLERDLSNIINKTTSESGKWFSVMGNPPLRQVFETALGLPTSFGTLDIDKQLGIFQEKSERYFGDQTVDQFKDPDRLDELTRLFLARSQIAQGAAAYSSNSIALTLLQNI
ncbi:Protein of unknown function [Aliiroseovarius halocynthiae]|uniref:DUF1217 domain-containing protein n=1 Tax=Aliiroseovarius halocynthiae TaxID=985055 RepID=A0A545SLP9_9RHOB|nr:DUF1217 domain-containing protein [Aliiroseovarius halocynthiae]TQV65903.1 DUF1217 domain-containing protein [Aliiroseovarius halocynthiae]SMR83466.1 Protein of unknown function [Aliiroseovarius halocynthiae]